MKDRIISKLTSGKFILTVSFAFTICAMGLQGKIPPDDIVKLGMIIVTFYFTRKMNRGGNGKNI